MAKRLTPQQKEYLRKTKQDAKQVLKKYGCQCAESKLSSQRLLVTKEKATAYLGLPTTISPIVCVIQFRLRNIKNLNKYTYGTKDKIDTKKLIDKYGYVLSIVISKANGTYQTAWLDENNYQSELMIRFALNKNGLERIVASKSGSSGKLL